MEGNLGKVAFCLLCLLIPACGPFLDWTDEHGGVIGGTTPIGRYKRDFWGNVYLERYDEDQPTSSMGIPRTTKEQAQSCPDRSDTTPIGR
jgi:hypothetical protein